MRRSPTSSTACVSQPAGAPETLYAKYASATSTPRRGQRSSTGPVASRTLSTACSPRSAKVACLRTAAGSVRSMRSAPSRSASDQGEAGRTRPLERTYAAPDPATPAAASSSATMVRTSVIPPAQSEEPEHLVFDGRRERNFKCAVGSRGHVRAIAQVGHALEDLSQLWMAPLPQDGFAPIAERMCAGDRHQRSCLRPAPERKAHSGVRVAAGERQAARQIRAGEHHVLRMDVGALDGRRAERAVELAGGGLRAKPGERLARFAAAAIELLHPRLAESEWRRKVERATVAGGGRGDVRSAQAEQPSHRSGDILGTLSTADGTESIGDCVAIERSAVSLAQPAADLA